MNWSRLSWPGGPDDWEMHQRREISRYMSLYAAEVHPTGRCMPLYPGSMLFNQIALFDVENPPEVTGYAEPQFESLDVVYEALGMCGTDRITDRLLLVDCQGWWPGLDLLLRREIEKHSKQHGRMLSVVVLAGRYSHRITSICNGLSIESKVIKPQWWSAAFLINLYRQSLHTVFVDTARALDAAMTGAECSLIVGDTYKQSPVFPALHGALSLIPCCSMPQKPVETKLTTSTRFVIVENACDELQYALTGDSQFCIANNINGCGGVGPVVRTGVCWQHLWKRKIGNLRVSTRRKARKLTEDPQAFFNDSKLPGSRAIASILPKPARESVADHTKRGAS